MVKHIKIALFICTFTFVLLGVGNAWGDSRSITASTSVMVVSSCSMSANVINHSKVIMNGQSDTIGSTTISTNCNDANGFSIYASGYTGGISNTVNSSSLIGAETGGIIPTGIGNDSSSKWSMRITAGTTGRVATMSDYFGSGEFVAVPSAYTKVASLGTSTDINSPTTITISYRATISPTQAADVYNGRVRYALIHPSSAVAATTFDSAFASAGKSTYINKAGIDTGYYTMQDMTSAICNGVVDYNTETQLIDTRDEKLYWVLKAQDGKCWMTENLDLDLETTPSSVAALTSLNTDLNVYDDDIYNEGYGYTYNESTGLITWTPSSATYHNNAIHQDGTKTGDNITNNSQNYSPRSWNLTVNGSEIYQKDGSTFDSAACNYFTTPACLGADKNFNTEPYAANGEHGKIGNYYNWSAAVASNNTTTRVDSTYNAIADNPKNSICPKGWRLTRSSSTPAYNDFQNLYSAYDNVFSKANGYPLWLVRAGYVSNGTL
ncbi:hypothetical protein IJI00_01655 [Candidatus Saccharibacteria bacterium]|nr:hypothetical protein [Candidatus Saccharibacteria bacterium]